MLIRLDTENRTARVLDPTPREPSVSLREARKAVGLTQGEAAQAACISRTYWGEVERGAVGLAVSLDVAHRIARTVCLPLTEITEFSPE